MHDGTVLRANVYRPGGTGPCPVLVSRLPYGKHTSVAAIGLDPLAAAHHLELPDDALEYRCRAATCRRYPGDTAAALEEFQALASDLRTSLPQDNRLRLDVRRQIGLLLIGAGEWGAALETLAEVHPAAKSGFAPESVETAEVRAALDSIRRLS